MPMSEIAFRSMGEGSDDGESGKSVRSKMPHAARSSQVEGRGKNNASDIHALTFA